MADNTVQRLALNRNTYTPKYSQNIGEEYNIENIVSDLRGENQDQGSGIPRLSTNELFKNHSEKRDRGVKDYAFDVPVESVYDRLSDGSYVAKFDNYLGAEGNEDRLARQQSTWEQLWHGGAKYLGKVGTYALDATVGTAYGIYNGISEGEWSAVWDNDFSNMLDDWNKQMDYALPNYYTDEQKSMGFMESMLTTNFWANDVGGGMAFVGGALLPELALASVTGGSTAPVSLGRLGLSSTLKSSAKTLTKKSLIRSADDVAESTIKQFPRRQPIISASDLEGVGRNLKIEKGVNLQRAYNRAKLGKMSGEVIKTTGFLARTSNFEAGMEARHNFHDAVESYYRDFERLNGRMPTQEEASEFMESATNAANGVYATNMGILAVSNAVMFGTRFNIGTNFTRNVNNFGNKFIGLGYSKDATGKLIMNKATKGQKIGGNIYKVLAKPATEGLYEEGFQGVAGQTMQNYLRAKYDPNVEATYGISSAIGDAFANQYGTKEGWKEMGIGFIIGSLGGVHQGQGIAGVGKNSWKAQYNKTEAQIKDFNEKYEARREAIINNMNNSNALANFVANRETDVDNYQGTDLNTTIENKLFIQSQEHLKPLKEIREDYKAVVENYEFSEEDISIIGEENIGEYKQSLIDQFDNNLRDYNFAKNIVRNIGMDQVLPNETQGNNFEVGNYLTTSIMLGRSAERSSKQIAQQIDQLVGEDGSYDALKFYNDLKTQKPQLLKDLSKKRKRLPTLEKRAKEYGRKLSGLSSNIKANFKEGTLQKRYNQTAEKHFNTTQEIADLREEIEQISNILNDQFKASEYKIEEDMFDLNILQNPSEYLDKLDNIEKYSKDLADNGRKKDAATLDYLVEQFKEYSDSFREMNNMVRDMSDQAFFESEKGKGLLNKIVGPKYKMSEEFREAVKENNEIIDNSLRRNGVRYDKTIDLFLEDVIENNETLSEREKSRVESLMRMQLGFARVMKNFQEKEEVDIKGAEEVSNTPLNGDTLSVRIGIDSQKETKTNLEEINKKIDLMMQEVEKIRGEKAKRTRARKLKNLRETIPNTPITEEFFEQFTSEEGVDSLPEEYTNDLALKIIEGREFSNNEKDVQKEFGQQIEDALQNIRNFIEMPTIVGAEEYIRLENLYDKKYKNDITPQELEEIEELEDQINEWLYVSGAVAEGQRLSDLLRMRAQLENTEITEVQEITDVSAQEKLNLSDFPDTKSTAKHYDKDLKYDSVVAKREKGNIKITGIKKDRLEQISGVEFDVVSEDEQGNVIITVDTAERINEANKVLIMPASENLATNYGVVQQVFQNGTTQPLKSDFDTDFNETMQPRESYKSAVGEEVEIIVDPQDPHNVKLLDAYRNAENETERKEALDNLKKGLVLRVTENIEGEKVFTGVLKADRGGRRVNELDKVFISLRNQIIDNEEFLKQISESSMKRKIPVEGNPTIQKVYLGHPNFLTVSNGDGTITIQNRRFTEQDAEKVVDIGYISRGKTETRSGVTEGVDMTFMSDSMKRKSRTPFVVFTVGNKRVAYPVSLNQLPKPDNKELRDIFNSNAASENKISALNNILAERGIDINTENNMFDFDNIENKEFFEQKLAQLENIDYFYDLEEWTKKRNDISDILTQQARIDINLSDPLHSPKLSLDYSTMNIDVSNFKVSQKKKRKAKKQTVSKKPEGKQTKLDFNEAEESTKEDC